MGEDLVGEQGVTPMESRTAGNTHEEAPDAPGIVRNASRMTSDAMIQDAFRTVPSGAAIPNGSERL
jgi:hypothetical protein